MCRRCVVRVRAALDDAPDVVALIRSQADPLTAAVYDRDKSATGKASAPPPPVGSDLIDASDEIVRALRGWAALAVCGVASDPVSLVGLAQGADAEAAHTVTAQLVDDIVAHLPRLLNHHEQAVHLCATLLDVPPADDPDGWTLAKAARRWPVVDRAFWAAQACPECSLRAVRVTPPRRAGGDSQFCCEGCGWERFDHDDDGLWVGMFSRRVSA